ncbi:MAG: response regulator [bacterium]
MLSVLTIDDEAEICEMINEFLTSKGFKVRTSLSGEEGIKLIDNEKPDVVLLDLMMPGMSGESVLKNIKERYHDLPVIIISGVNDPDKIIELLNEGASDFINKPINWGHLEHHLLVWENYNRHVV